MEFGNAVMAGGRCDRCDGPISNTRVIVTLAAADTEVVLHATLCTMRCAQSWLAASPAALKGVRAELAAKSQSEPDPHQALLAAFEAEEKAKERE